MRKNPFLKAVLRKPFRSLLMLLLMGAITYGITSHVIEYVIVLQMTNQLEKYYRPIGTLESENYDVTRGRELVSHSPYIEFEDIRRIPQGILQGLYNADVSNSFNRAKTEKIKLESYVSDVVFYGVLQEKKYVIVGSGQYHFTFKINKMEVGYPDYMPEDNLIHVKYQPETEGELKEEYDSLIVGEQYLVRAYYDENSPQSMNRSAQIIEGKIGKWFLLDKLTDDNLYFYPVKEGDTVDYSNRKLAGLKEHLEIVAQNQRAMEVHGTKDMSLMPPFQESSRTYYLVDGRWLDREDDLNKKNVCVVHSFFAEWRGLSLGDKINIELRDMGGVYNGYIIPLFPEMWNNWRSYKTVEKEFEIVGIYDSVYLDLSTARGNRIFVPDSCIPENFLLQTREMIYSSTYSFVLKSAKDQQAFLIENKSKLEGMGITLSFIDNDADDFGIASKALKKSTQMSVAIFSATFLPVMVIVAFFYLSQHRREFAIARAMGIPRKLAIYQVGVAAIWIGLSGIIIGGIAAWYKTLKEAKDLFKGFVIPGVIEYNSSLRIFWLLLMLLLFSLFVILILLGSCYIANQSVFDLLQGQKLNIGRKNMGQINGEKVDIQPDPRVKIDEKVEEIFYFSDSCKEFIVDTIGKKNASRKYKLTTSIEYLYRHMLRSYGKLILMFIITLGFIATYSWFDIAIEKNKIEIDQLYNSTVIKGEILKEGIFDFSKGGGFINPKVVNNLQDSGLIKESYLEKTALVNGLTGFNPHKTYDRDAFIPGVAVVSFNEWDRFFIETGAGITVKFMKGYDEKVFMENESESVEAIVPERLMKKLGKRWGDIIYLIIKEEYTPCRIIGSYEGELSSAVLSDTIIMSEYHMEQLMGNNFFYVVTKFTFDSAKNKELLQKEKELKDMVSSAKFGSIEPRLVIWDEELQQVIEPMERNLSFLKIIYPIAVIVFTLIGGVLNFLIISFRAKEAAIIRILGGTKRKVRTLFIVEQGIIYLTGIILGVILIVMLQGGISPNILMNILLYLTGCTLGSILGSIFVTNKIPLELLQVKE